MLGAYIGYSVAQASSFWLALVAAPLALAGIGLVAERFGLRYLSHRPVLELALLTLGVAFVIEHVVITVWGAQDLALPAPAALQGPVDVFGTSYPAYRLFVIVVAFALMGALALWLRTSRTGLYIRAASHDRETTSMMGVHIDRVSTTVVALAAALAGLAGVLAGPYLALTPGMGTQVIIISLVVVVAGGLGSIGGAAVAALAFGLIQTVGTSIGPAVSVLTPYVLLIAILLWRPTGLAGRRAH